MANEKREYKTIEVVVKNSRVSEKNGNVGVLVGDLWYNIHSRDISKTGTPEVGKRYKITYSESNFNGKDYRWVSRMDLVTAEPPPAQSPTTQGTVHVPESKIATNVDREVSIARQNCSTNAVALTKLYAEVNVTLGNWAKLTDAEVLGFIKQRRKELYDILVADVLSEAVKKATVSEEEIPF